MGRKQAKNNLSLSNSAEEGSVSLWVHSCSHGHKAAALLKETFLGPVPLPSCSFLPWTRPFLLQTLLDEWHKGIFLFKHSLLGTLALLLRWCSKIIQVTAQERIGVQEISQGSAWPAAPGQGQAPSRSEQLIWVVEGHQSLHQRLSILPTEITQENSYPGFCPISPAISCPLF